MLFRIRGAIMVESFELKLTPLTINANLQPFFSNDILYRMKDEVKKETDTEMLARMMANGFEQLGNQIKAVHSDSQGQFNGLQGQFNELRDEMHTGFSDIRLEIRDLNRSVESLKQKLSGVRESLDETVLKSEFIELKNKVLALEAHFA
jgi:hypothetical protein